MNENAEAARRLIEVALETAVDVGIAALIAVPAWSWVGLPGVKQVVTGAFKLFAGFLSKNCGLAVSDFIIDSETAQEAREARAARDQVYSAQTPEEREHALAEFRRAYGALIRFRKLRSADQER